MQQQPHPPQQREAEEVPDPKFLSDAVCLHHPGLEVGHLLPRNADVQFEALVLPCGEGCSHPLRACTLSLQFALELVEDTLDI